MGLGLPLVMRIAELRGGAVEARSDRIGHGGELWSACLLPSRGMNRCPLRALPVQALASLYNVM